MTLSVSPRIALLFGGITLALAATVHAQSSVPSLSADELCRTSLKDGDEVVVTGKYKELIDDELYLFDCGKPFHIEDQRLFAQLLNYTPTRDNFTITGVVGRVRGERVIRVRELKPALGDFALFNEQYVALAKLEPGERADRLIHLGRRILRAHTQWSQPRLVPLARQVFQDALELKTDMQTIRKVHEWLQDAEFARDMVLRLLKESPGNEDALKFLREIQCRKYDDRWVTHEEYKRLEGLVQYEGGWITPREFHHLKALEQFALQPKTNLILLRRRTEKEYVLVAEEGRVETGMRREEVCLALGFPDFVLRRAYKRKEFDQWSYGNKYYYFYDGILVFVPAEK